MSFPAAYSAIPSFNVTAIIRGTHHTLLLSGELDIATRPALTAAAAAVPRGTPVILDLAGLTFTDCAGYGALLAVIRALERQGLELRPEPVPRCVRRIAQLTGDSRFTRDGRYVPAAGPLLSVLPPPRRVLLRSLLRNSTGDS